MKIAIDLDEVLGDFVGAFLRWHNHRFKTRWQKEDIVRYHVEEIMDIPQEEAHERIHLFFEEELGNIPPMKGAEDAVRILSQRHELYVVSARHNYLRLPTEQWLERHFPKMFRGLHLVEDGLQNGEAEKTKGEICRELNCDLLIDDGSHHVESLLTAGLKVIIFSHPWNIYHRFPPKVQRAENWQEVLGVIKELEEAHV